MCRLHCVIFSFVYFILPIIRNCHISYISKRLADKKELEKQITMHLADGYLNGTRDLAQLILRYSLMFPLKKIQLVLGIDPFSHFRRFRGPESYKMCDILEDNMKPFDNPWVNPFIKSRLVN